MTRIRLVAAVAAILCAGCHDSAPPGRLKPDDIAGYMSRLGASNSAEANDIRTRLKSAAADLARERGEALKEHVPLTPGDLFGPDVPAPENAAALYPKLHQLLPRKRDPKSIIALGMSARSSYTPGQLKQARSELAKNARVLQMIRQISDHPRCNFRRNWAFGVATLTPEFADMRKAAYLLTAEGYLLTLDGQPEMAIKELTRGFRIADHAGSDQTQMASLYQISVDSLCLRGLESVVRMSSHNPKVLSAVKTAILSNRPHYEPVRHANGNLVVALVSLAKMRNQPQQALAVLYELDIAGANKTYPPPTPDESRFLSNLFDAAEAECISRTRKLDAALQVQLVQARTKIATILPALSENPPDNPIEALVEEFLTVSPEAFDKPLQMDSQAAAIVAATDILVWKANHDSWPESIDQLPGNLPMDAFTGRPLKYRKEPNGFVVYSVGPTGNFDGGKPGMKQEPKQAYFRYPGDPPKPYVSPTGNKR